MASIDPEIARTQEERKKMEQQLSSLTSVNYDPELYGGTNKFEDYVSSIPVNDEEENVDAMDPGLGRRLPSYTAPASLLKEMPRGGVEEDDMGFKKPQRIIDREDDYRRRRLNRVISPDRHDAFASGDKTPDVSVRTYADVMREEARNRWDQSQDDGSAKKAKTGSDWDLPDSTPGIGRWDATPTPGRVADATPSISRRNRWDETPTPGLATPTPKRQRSRWDETPATMGSATPMAGATPAAAYTPERNRPLTDEELDAMFPQEALRQLTDKAREFGAGPLFNRILPLLMQPTLEDQERHLLITMHVNTTARAFSVVASALGIPALLPFLKAVCQSKKSWQARHTGIKIVQQIAILIGCAVLPHLRSLVEIIEHGLNDENQKVRTITALSLAALAEAAAPYGIESFDSVLKPLWKGIRSHRGKVLAAFLKAIGFIIPLMDAIYASYYTKEVVFILIREFQSPDEEMKKIVLKVVKQCVSTEGVEADYIRNDILPEFFRNFWVRRMALDRRNYRQLVDTTVEIANKVGVADIVGRIVEDLKDESEPYRRMVMETIEKFVPAREWMRICFELLEMLKAHKKGIRRATVNTFGYIAKAIGPQDVLATLLNNLKVQERQNRVCTTVAIAIYIGEMGKDYIYAVTPLLEDALMDRDLVHRQTAASAVKHMALGVAGLAQDALVAAYPLLEDEQNNIYSRPELVMFI
ncbi:unnamed protein product, partial [Vitis vinifera]